MSACRIYADDDGIRGCVTLTHVHEDSDPDKPITHVLCQLCLEWTAVTDLFVDADGQKWDYCKECEGR